VALCAATSARVRLHTAEHAELLDPALALEADADHPPECRDKRAKTGVLCSTAACPRQTLTAAW
jgi:hypothetical protein